MNKLQHVAVITDGNGRWATQRGLPRSSGHDQGRETFWNLCNWCLEAGIPYLTFYVMSLENLQRDPAEVNHIFEIGRSIYGGGGVEKCRELGIRLIGAGDRSRMSEEDRACLAKGEADTAGCKKLICVLCVCYGGRDEIVRAANAALVAGEKITEESISRHLYAASHGVPDPEMIIRTGGYARLSGFLPWQGIYSELYITPTLFPDLSREEFQWACKWFSGIHRTHGGDREKKTHEPEIKSQGSEKKVPFARKEN